MTCYWKFELFYHFGIGTFHFQKSQCTAVLLSQVSAFLFKLIQNLFTNGVIFQSIGSRCNKTSENLDIHYKSTDSTASARRWDNDIVLILYFGYFGEPWISGQIFAQEHNDVVPLLYQKALRNKTENMVDTIKETCYLRSKKQKKTFVYRERQVAYNSFIT